MPITDNSFTADELQAAVTANPALAAQLKTFGEKAEYVIRTKAEDTTFLAGFEKQKVDARTSELANGIEADIKATFGEDKLENEKYHEYFKRVAGKTVQSLTSMKTELETLKADPHNSTADKARIKQLEDAITAEKTTQGTKLAEKETQISNLKSGFEIERSLNKVRGTYVLGIPEIATKAIEDKVIGELLPIIKEVEPGKFVIMNEDKTVKLDPATFQPVTIDAEIKTRLVDIIDKNKVQTGTGTQQQQQQQQQQDGYVQKDPASGKISAVTSIPETIKTKVQLNEWLGKLGLTQDSKEFNDAFAKFGEKLPLR